MMALISQGYAMKRDDDLLRDLMLQIEERPEPIFHFIPKLSVEVQAKTYFHLRLLADAGLLEESGKHGGEFRMTNSGHDFLAAIRSDTNWHRAKSTAAKVSGAGVGMLRDIAIGYVRQELVKLGVPLG